MAADLQTAARAALAAIAADSATSGSAVTVEYDGDSTTGIRGVTTNMGAADVMGELGGVVNLVRLPADGIAQPPAGATIIVDDERVTVVNVRMDPVGAMFVIEYEEQRVRE